jgi:glycosyltransferase involved in cell wall biosynthesis
MVSVLILTKNEERDLPDCLKSVSWCDDVHVYDSFSDDHTVEIAESFGAHITQKKFENWSSHQNWGLSNIRFKHEWVLYIDADERVTEELRDSVIAASQSNENFVAYEIQRRDFSWNGVWLKHAQISPFYLRFFKPDKMKYERLVNPISIPDGLTSSIKGFLDHYPFSKGIKAWIQRHLGYADMEAKMRLADLEEGKAFSFRKALFSKDFTEKRYHQKGIFYKMPGRPMIKWIYMVIWRRAFLDGSAGLTYAFLQSIYEYFIILRTNELIYNAKKSEVS